MKIEQISPSKLKFSEYNPRAMKESEVKDLEASIKKFGFVEPVIANSAPKRKNILIGGHQRVKVAIRLGLKEVPVHYVDIPDMDKERELNLRLNKNLGHWDYDLLANFDQDMLVDVGFESEELMESFGLDSAESVEVDVERLRVITVEPPESPKLKERMAFYCDNMEEYEKIKKYFRKGKSDLDKNKLIKML